MTITREQLVADVEGKKCGLKYAEDKLAEFDQAPENNRFETEDDAEGALYEMLRDRAHADCEGSYNCGNSEYEQGFFVGDQEYVAVAKVEYNRHDKMYYFIEEFDIEFHKKGDYRIKTPDGVSPAEAAFLGIPMYFQV